MSTLIGRSKKQVFQIMIDRVLNRLKGWKEASLTKAGREILLKAVVQAIPTYAMSCFIFPHSVCETIEKAAISFYWGAKGEERKTHWASWAKVTRSKERGGLGFRELYFFNLAMVAKQYWRILHQPQSMVARILKARHFPRRDVGNAKIGFQPSYL